MEQRAGERYHAAFLELPGTVVGYQVGGGEHLAEVDGIDVDAEGLEVQGSQEGDFVGDDGYVFRGLEGGVADALELGLDFRSEARDREKLKQSAVGIWDGVCIHSVQ